MVNVWHNGRMTLTSTQCPCGAGDPGIDTSFCATLAVDKTAVLNIVGATVQSPFVLSLDSITKVRALAIQILNGATITMNYTQAATAKALNISGPLVMYLPNAGDEITAITFVGTANLAIRLAGDST